MIGLTAAALAAAVCASGGAPVHPDRSPAPLQTDPGPQYSRDWKRLRSEHFVAAGNAGYVDMRRVLLELEGFRRALAGSIPALRQAPPVPTIVVVFRDDRAFAPFKPKDERGRRRDTIAGYFLSAPGANYMAVAMHRDVSRTFHYLFHEYTHHIVRRLMPSAPPWLNEGLAELYSTFQARPQEGYGLLGLPPINRLATLRRGDLLPLRDVLTLGDAELAKAGPDRSAAFYAQAWALVHYLQLADGGAHRAGVARLLDGLRSGTALEPAVQSAFGFGIEELERRLRAYGHSGTFPRLRVDDPQGNAPVRTSLEVMLQADVDALQRQLLALLEQSSGNREAPGSRLPRVRRGRRYHTVCSTPHGCSSVASRGRTPVSSWNC